MYKIAPPPWGEEIESSYWGRNSSGEARQKGRGEGKREEGKGKVIGKKGKEGEGKREKGTGIEEGKGNIRGERR